MVYISVNDLEFIHNLLEKNVETCGTFIEHVDKLKIFVEKLANQEASSCTHEAYTSYIWHTHPYNAKGYPSAEDIVKILKWRPDNKPKTSIIFTKWGIWEMSADNKKKLQTEHIQDLLKIGSEFDGLYHITDRGRLLSERTFPFLQSTINAIEYNINRKANFGLRINFTPWKEIRGAYVLKN